MSRHDIGAIDFSERPWNYCESVLPAPSVEDVLRRLDEFGTERKAADRVVSIVFANPGSPVWDDLQTNRAFLDDRSGNDWDLFFAGLSGFAPSDDGAKAVGRGWRGEIPKFFNPRSFTQIEQWIAMGHASALAAANLGTSPWTYRGGTDVVSFIAYGRDPDFLSLKSAPLYSPSGDLLTLVHITEGLAKWKLDHVDPLLAPGEVLRGISDDTGWLAAGLGWTTSAVVGGVLGNSVYEVIRKLI